MKSTRPIFIALFIFLSFFIIDIHAAGTTNDGASWWNSEYNTTEGTDFWVTFMRNAGADETDDKNMELFLYFTAREQTNVTISNPNIGGATKIVTIPAGQQQQVKVDNSWGYIQLPQDPSNFGVHITSEKPVSVYSTSHHNSGKYDGSNIIPTNALLGSYIVQTYLRDDAATEFAIVATTSQTIRIHIKETVLDQNEFENNNEQKIIQTIDKDITVSLAEGQTYLYRSSNIMGSLSGTTLCSDKPFALFQGGQSVTIPSDPLNHIFHQSYSTDLYGDTFIVTPTHNARYDYIRITAAENNTEIRRDGILKATINAFETFQDTIESSVVYDSGNIIFTPSIGIYTTNEAAECFLYGTGYGENVPENAPFSYKQTQGSAVMTAIVPQQYAMHSCIFATFQDFSQEIMKHYVNIVVKTSEISGMHLDGRSISDEFHNIPTAPTYSYAIMEISRGAHKIDNTNNGINSCFTARVYGLGVNKAGNKRESYAYSVGSRVNRSADLLIDGQYIKEKGICITNGVTFTPIINYDFSRYWFHYYKSGSTTGTATTTTPKNILTDFTHQFPDTGKWEVDLIVERTTPICDYHLYDTIRANIIVHDTIHLDYGYDDKKETNICYGGEFTVHYDSTKYQYIADTTTLQTLWGKQQKFELNRTYTFIDTLQNKWGCDSIISQTVCIRPTYEYTVYDTICHKEIPYTYIDPITGKANDGKLSNLTKSGDYTDYRHTYYGCDSIIHLHLLVNPDYLIDTTKQICSNQDFYWQGRHYVGDNFSPISEGDIIVHPGTKYDSIHYWTSNPHQCDSIHTLHLTVKDTFIVSMTYTTCVHVPLSPAPNFNLSKFPEYSIDKVGTQVYIDNLTTQAGCDSIVIFTLHVLPRYDILEVDTVCQHPTNQYIWEHHTGYDILDSIANKHIRTIPTNKHGWHTYIDHQYTHPGHCDSIHTLRLYVAPVYSFTEQREMCDNESIEWRGKVFVGNKVPDNYKAGADTDHILKAGTYQDIDTAHYTTIIGCDSIYHLNLLVKPTAQTTLTYHHCTSEDTVTYENTQFDLSYVRTIDTTFHYSTATKCDSAVVLHIVIDSAYYFMEDSTVCQHSPFVWNKHDTVKISTDNAGDFVYYDRLKTKHGCDSIYQLNLRINPTYRTIEKPLRICDSDSIRWKGRLYVGDKAPQSVKDLTTPECILSYKEGGYIDSIRYNSQSGCDSMRVVQIFVDTTTITHLHYHYCTSEKQITLEKTPFDISYVRTIDTTFHYSTATKCDSAVVLHIVIDSAYYFMEDSTVCQHSPFVWNKHDTVKISTDNAGDFVYYDRLKTKHGCDSIYQLNLRINPTYRTIETPLRICDSDSIRWKGRLYVGDKAPLSVKALTTPERILPYKDGGYIDSIRYNSQSGCDSMRVVQIFVDTTTITHLHYHYCTSEKQITLEKTPFNISYVRNIDTTFHYSTATKCDSAVVLHIVVDSAYYFMENSTVCQHSPFAWSKHDTVKISTNTAGDFTYYHRLKTKQGCDSIYQLNLRINPTYRTIETPLRICDSDSIRWEGRLYVGDKAPQSVKDLTTPERILPYKDGGYIDSIRYNSQFGCDSMQVVQIFVDTTTITHLHYHYCTSEKQITLEKTSFDISYVRTIDTTFHYSTATKCDSAVVLHITVDSAYYFVENSTVCQHSPFVWYKHDTVKISTDNAGDFVYYDRLKTTHGCDSMYQLNLHVNPTYYFYETHTICEGDSIEWQKQYRHGKDTVRIESTDYFGDRMFVTTDYTAAYQTQAGCDSIYYLHLIVNPRKHTHVDYTMCDYKDYDFNGKPYRRPAAGTYLDTVHLQTAHSCDSVVTLRLVVNPSYNNTKIDTICASAVPYTIDYGQQTYSFYQTTDTILQTPSSTDCDSVLHLQLQVNPTYYFYDTLTICEGDSVEWQKQYRYGKDTARIESTDYFGDRMFVTTDYTAAYQTQAGCDSIYHLHLIVQFRKHTHLNAHICENEQYRFGDSIVIQRQLGYYHDTLILNTAAGCDSILTLELTVHPTYHKQHHDTICQNDNYIWKNHQDHNIYSVEQKQYLTSIPTDTYGDWVFIDSLQTQTCKDCPNHGCDSIWTLYLHINPTYYSEDTITMSDEEIRKWEHTIYAGCKVSIDTINSDWFLPETTQGMAKPQIIRIPQDSIINHFDTTYLTIDQCDSIRSLRLLVGPTYRDTITRWTCDNEPYHWYHDGDDKEARTDLTLLKPQHYYDSLKTKEFGFDSIYVLDLHNYQTYQFAHQDTVCQSVDYTWEGHNESKQIYSVNLQQWIDADKIPISVPGIYTYIDSLKTKEPPTHTNQILNHGCDSVWTLTLVVPPSYYFDSTLTICDNDSVCWQRILYTGNQFTAFHKTYNSTKYDSIKTLSAGTYYDTLRYETKTFLCDSIYRLKLIVLPTYHSEFERHACQESDTYYEQMDNGAGGTVPTNIAGTIIYYDTIHALGNGCDSVIKMTYHIHPTYHYLQHDTICQDTISTVYEWQDEFGGMHDNIAISIAKSGDFYFGDTLSTIFGCDSTFGIHLHVSPIYRFDSTYTICDNEVVTWQGRRYVGNKYSNITSSDIVVGAGIHNDAAHYLTIENCDSTYYLQLIVHPTYDTISYITSCKNEDYVWLQSDHNGMYTDSLWKGIMVDTFRISNEEAILPQPYKYPDTIRYERMLNSIYDCDSLSHIELTLHSAYLFYTDTAICSNEKLLWRGRYFGSHDTICTDKYTTSAGCDSIYQLRLHIYPAYLFSTFHDICDNETIYHNNNGIDVVWAPGMPISDYTELQYFSIAGCDSVYRYYLTIHPTYYTEENTTLCSNEPYLFHQDHLINLDTEYDTHLHISSFDTVFVDSLSTVWGCDSVFRLNAHINPAYHYVDYDTICDNGFIVWRKYDYANLSAGDYVYWDSLHTSLGCDSVYELRLKVWPTYLFESHETICADETYTFQGNILNQTGFYYDSLVSSHHCDSVYHLYLTVLDTTYESIVDTICYGETYMLHNTPITSPGFYKDTTFNAWGCHHFTYLRLGMLPPTIAHLMADSVCMDKEAFELGYWYEGLAPASYSLLFDDFGHEQGFEDQHHITFDSDSVVLLPMPQRTLEDPTQYPRPDHYPVTLVLHNGYCINDSLYPSTEDIIMNYPSWVTEQRFRDVIAILDTKYNGGYEFSTFQWYRNGQPMPGETHEYLYLPHEMDVDTVEYYVRVTRPGESESFQTCPIRIFEDPIDTLAPRLPYISVVPTLVPRIHPVVNILSVNKGHYRIYNGQGKLCLSGEIIPTGTLDASGEFVPDKHHAMEIELKAESAMYIFWLRDDETEHREKERVIKVIVQ